MKYYPAFLDLRGKPVVVIGGGRVAERKVRTLISCGARVTVVSPVLTKPLARFGRNGEIRIRKRGWRPADLKNTMLILAATNYRKTNSEIARLADFRTRLVNAVDDPDRCSFIAPAILT
ncbi:MAG TPA: bifunctional precorrin-2 dehydrogenase/sirohydrochlorin ferrochelatase, partial [Nitrospiria bacterium]